MQINTDTQTTLEYATHANLKQTDYKVLLSLIVWSKNMKFNIGPSEAGRRLNLSPQAVSRSYRHLKQVNLVHENELGGYTIGAPKDFISGQKSLGL